MRLLQCLQRPRSKRKTQQWQVVVPGERVLTGGAMRSWEHQVQCDRIGAGRIGPRLLDHDRKSMDQHIEKAADGQAQQGRKSNDGEVVRHAQKTWPSRKMGKYMATRITRLLPRAPR